jgi:hypothetical protein
LVPVLIAAGERDRRQHIGCERNICHDRHIAPIVAAAGDLTLDPKFIPGSARDDTDSATDGIATEQGSLRPLQDFNVIDIHQILVRAHGTGKINTINVDPDSRVQIEGEIVLTNAANRGGQN